VSEWYEEDYHPHWRQRFEVERYVYRGRTEFQEAIVFESPLFGRVLALDGIVQTTERDEFVYHEMISHVAVVAHGAVRDVLIIGGGDGGTLEEVLKHRSIACATMVELDPGVVEIAKAHLPGINRGAFGDPRTELIFGDGVKFVAESERQFDVIIVDSTDPFGPGEALFTAAFYADCRARLRPDGILVAQSGNPFMERDRLEACLTRLRKAFRDTSFILTSVPSYLGGPFVFAWGCDDPAKRRLGPDELAARPLPKGLRCYTPAVHAAAFAHPLWLQARLDGGS
jgi:spermidine synthase